MGAVADDGEQALQAPLFGEAELSVIGLELFQKELSELGSESGDSGGPQVDNNGLVNKKKVVKEKERVRERGVKQRDYQQ